MLSVENVHTARRERIIKGANNWWFLGPGGTARLSDGHLAGNGALTPSAEASLRTAGLFTVPAAKAYSLTVLTSTDCNLGCAYCFQNTAQDSTGGHRPPRIEHARLTSETIGSILTFTERQMGEAGLESLDLMLFGGEPLLNFKGCKELLSRAGDYGLSMARMISNGVLLTPLVARELAARGLRSVQITFDGARSDHDGIRVRRSGGGTFDSIVTNIARASEASPLHWGLRVNVSHHNLAAISGLIDELAERLDPSRCTLYFALVGDTGVGYQNELLRSGELTDMFIDWHRRAIRAGFETVQPAAHQACQACSFLDGRWGAVVNPDGTLYSCWETSGKPGWEVGTIADGYRPANEIADRWVQCGYDYRVSEGATELQAFADQVDAALLDELVAAGRL